MRSRFSASANGTRNTGPVNMGGGPNLVERSLFASNTPSLSYSQWYTPGSGSPAISTADYYHIGGLYWPRPYDLDAMGSEGATIKAREGGKRYVWMIGPDHPSTTNFRGNGDICVGYSSDPHIFPDPSTIRMLKAQVTAVTLTDQNGSSQVNYGMYQTPHLVYNPDSAGDKFYIYGESTANGFQHELGLITTSDFLTYTELGPAIPTTAFAGWASFGRPQRLGVNNWVVYSFGTVNGVSANPIPSYYKYTSTDGFAWTPDYSQVVLGGGPFLTVAGQDYMLGLERGTNDYISIFSVDSNKLYTGTTTRISTAFGNSTGNTTDYPGPTYLQDVGCYEEDGIASIYATRGFFSGVNNELMDGPYLGNSPTFFDITASITSNVMDVTSIPVGAPPLQVGFRLRISSAMIVITSFGTGTGGIGTYNVTATSNRASGTINIASNGGLWQQFVDLYYLTTDASSAANAAPLGVKADCTSGTVTVSWDNVPPGRTYRIYRGTSSATQSTLVGDVTGTSITDTPTLNAQYWYKVVTLNGGVEQKNRVVDVYVSNNSQMVNRHVRRVINDGGDTTKIDMTFLASVDSYLTSNNYYRYLLYWVDARFGVKLDGSGFVSKVYCLGTTRLPRGGDYTPTTSNTFPSTSSNTSYSATSFRGTTPSWVNNASTARGYFGNGRTNQIQRKNELTLIAAYQRPNTTGIVSFFGTGQFSSGFYLQQASGTSGNVTFAIESTPSTAAFASGTAAHVAAGVYDGTNLTCILDGVAGTPVDGTSFTNPTMTKSNALRGDYGSSSYSTTMTLMSGTRSGLSTNASKTYNTSDSQGQFTCACLAVFEKGSTQIVSDITAMYA
jgi:hypothetical protein